jgi:hypothetical protein
MTPHGKRGVLFTWLAVVPFLLFSLSLPFWSNSLPSCCSSDVVKAITLGIWTIGIPAWYLYEWTWIEPNIYTNLEGNDAKSYKEGRDLSQKLWLAVAAFLTLVYFGDQLKPSNKEEIKKLEERISNLERKGK